MKINLCISEYNIPSIRSAKSADFKLQQTIKDNTNSQKIFIYSKGR